VCGQQRALSLGRQLQYGRPLSFFQRVQENDLAVWEFQRVVMTYGVLSVDLSN
jgi:hypothetical protein